MKIGLYDIDSKIPNLALMKISAWHKKQGDETELFFPLKANLYDKVYASQIFTWSKPIYRYDEIGGSGTKNWGMVLSEEIEHIMPDYDLYPNMDYSLGFTTRGCIRNCEFCIVRQKEGFIKTNADIYEFWNKKHKRIVFLDNNANAQPIHLKKILSQVRKEGLTVEFNQGLDIRLLTLDIAKELKKTRLSELWFAWDNIKDEKSVLRGIDILKKAGIKNFRFYVLVGFNSTFEEDLYRFNTLKKINQEKKLNIRPYCMRYNTVKKISKYIRLAEWVNMPQFWTKMDYERFVKKQIEYSKRVKFQEAKSKALL